MLCTLLYSVSHSQWVRIQHGSRLSCRIDTWPRYSRSRTSHLASLSPFAPFESIHPSSIGLFVLVWFVYFVGLLACVKMNPLFRRTGTLLLRIEERHVIFETFSLLFAHGCDYVRVRVCMRVCICLLTRANSSVDIRHPSLSFSLSSVKLHQRTSSRKASILGAFQSTWLNSQFV